MARIELFGEDFETDGSGSRYTLSVPEFTDGSRDFFTRTDGSNISAAYEVTGFEGDFFFAAQDLDGEGDAFTQTLEFTGIDVTGFGALQFSGLFAEDDNGSAQDWDLSESLVVQYRFDGGEYRNLLAFGVDEDDADGLNGQPLLDTDFDGRGDGAALTDTFQAFTADIIGAGDVLDIRVTVALNSGNEDIAFDDFSVTGESLGSVISILADDAVKTEGDADVTEFTFGVTRTGNLSEATSVDYVVTSLQADAADFGGAFPTGTVSFGANDASGLIVIPVLGDETFEADETFTVELVNPAENARLAGSDDSFADASAVGVIENDDAFAAGSFVINEVLYDPATDITGDANGDGTRDFAEDEFIEIVNVSVGSVDISGWTLSDDDGGDFEFPSGTVIASGQAVVLFGGGTPTGTFGGATIFTDDGSIGSGLSNSGDLIELKDGSGLVIASLAYGSAGSVTGGSDVALQLDPELTGSSYSDHSSVTGSGGALFSPGTQVDGTAFGSITPTGFDLQITEIWPGQDGVDLTEDWFEITNVGDTAWTAATDGALFYDDESADPSAADQVFGLASLAAGASAVVVVGDAADAEAFQGVWSEVIDLTGVDIGWADGAGLGQGGDAVNVWLGDPLSGGSIIDTESYPDASSNSGQSYDVDAEAFSVAGQGGAVSTLALGGTGGAEPAVGSPGEGAAIVIPKSLKIHEIQGPGDTSPEEGELVTVQAIVTADFQAGDSDLNGFFIQEEDADVDVNALTSEGIFVFDGAAPAVNVNVGDLVTVTGTVVEFQGETQLEDVTVTIDASNVTLPSATAVTFPVAGTTTDNTGEPIPDLEQYEGMLVSFAQEGTVTELFNLDRYGQFTLSYDGRPEQFTQTNTPDATAFAQFKDDLAKVTITVDDGQRLQNPDPVPYPDGDLDTADSFRMGDTVTGLTGVVRFSTSTNEFNAGSTNTTEYRILPTVDPVFVQENPREDAPSIDGLAVATVNVENWFTTLDVRGADDATELERQSEKLPLGLTALGADIIALIEIENDFSGSGSSAIETLVDLMNAIEGAGTYDWVDPGVSQVGTDEIANAFIYRTSAVKVADGTTVEFLEDADLTGLGLSGLTPVFDGSNTSRNPLAVTFEELSSGHEFTAVANHYKSKRDGGASGVNADQDDGAGPWDQRREDASTALKAWLDTDPTGSGDADVLILGDLNAYAAEDPITALTGDGYTDLVQAFDDGTDPAYTFVFDGQTGTLDYALGNDAATQQTGAAEVWHVNADEADALDYNLDFGRPSDIFDGSSPARFSDHDPIVVGLNLGVYTGTAGVDTIIGSDLDDTLIGLGSGDTIDGGEGVDTVDYSASAFAVDVRLWRADTMANGSGDAQGDIITNVEAVIGSAFNDGLAGANGQSNTLDGQDGNDFLFGARQGDLLIGGNGTDLLVGRGGQDTLLGGADQDILNGGAAADVLDGGESDLDVATYEDSPRGVDVRLWRAVQEKGHANGDTLTNIEGLIGSQFADGLALANGTAGALSGLGGNDFLFGANGNDLLFGDAGEDVLDGRNGDDILDGGVDGETDILTGGRGTDTFVIGAGGGNETITDFRAGVDQIALTADVVDIDTFAELTLGDTAQGATVSGYSTLGEVLLLEGVLSTDLSALDFTFA